jgi:hypothetical protein
VALRIPYHECSAKVGASPRSNVVTKLFDSRRSKNTRHKLSGLFRQAVLGRLAGYEDVNDAEPLARDPATLAIVGRDGFNPSRRVDQLRPKPTPLAV